MASKLDRFLETIDPSRNYDQLWSRADEALNSFPMEKASEDDWEEFNRILARFSCHMQNAMLRLRIPMSPNYDFHQNMCFSLLEKEYGAEAAKAAFEVARTGAEGGLYGILKTIARLMVEDYAGNEIRNRVAVFLGDLSTDERLAMPFEYVEKYGHLLPSEITEDSAVRIRFNFSRVLEEHPRMLNKLRNTGW